LSGGQLSHLLSHDWPGNVRELANVAERQVLGLGEPEPVGIDPGQSLAAQQEAFEAQCLRAALTRHKGDVKAVLEELQLPRRTFNEKMQRHGLNRESFYRTADFSAACTGLFAAMRRADKPAPTGFSGSHKICEHPGPCGSGLAREEAGTSNKYGSE
jgi:hypothetical protein